MNTQYAKTIYAFVICLLVGALILPASAEEVVARGSFIGKSRHTTTGGVTIVRQSDKTVVILESDFGFDGAPDPKLGFGNDGHYDRASQFSPLKSNKGRQEYVLPDSTDPSNYNELYVWCEKYSVPLGVTQLK